MEFKDDGSTVGLLTNPNQHHRLFKEEMKLAQLLRQKRVNNECCQKKLADVQRHYQGKPLHTLRFSDVVCCCEVDMAEIAQVQAIIHAWCNDDDNVDDGADTNMTINCCNVVEAGVYKDAAYQDGREDICVDAHRGLTEGYGNGEDEGTHVDNNGDDGNLVVRGANTEKDLQSCTSEPTQQVYSIKKYLHQPRMKRFKPFSYHDDSSRPHISHDLLLDVLLRGMPLAQIISARVVCRAWHEVLTSPQCFNLLSKNPGAARHYLILQTSSAVNPSGLTFFDKERKCWLCTPIELPHLPLLAAAGGLLCLADNFSSPSWGRVLLVGNPLTQQWKELPPVPMLEEEDGHSPWCGMSADWQEACYKVFVVYSYSDRMCVYTYKSTTGQWNAFKQDHAKAVMVDSALEASLLKRTLTVSRQGYLLCVSCGERRILSYNVADGSFQEIKLGDPLGLDVFDLNIKSAPYARLPTTLLCGEKFYLVGRGQTL
ncbi:hypothetical protein GOP47_0006743 [Adiantum capillus-veneris]|uniref:F-box protein At3g26010-like beta-propeller domain-containing protein n=1 Tax=Adiantum capillus-veneris TaxID=13818 RepID=A0A9D4ZMB9_ADICA|nr:hypothetical protein GOP47_0006743 [Adiantum capillus-veneris]